MVVGFCFIGSWCYSERWVLDLMTLAWLQGSETSPGLFQDFNGWVYKTLRLSPSVVEYNVVVMSARLNPMSSQFSIPVLRTLCSKSVGALNVETQLRTPKLVVWVQLPLEWNTCLLFNTDIANFVWKIGEGEAVLWRCLNLRWMKDGGVGQKVLFRASWNRIFFQAWFQPK